MRSVRTGRFDSSADENAERARGSDTLPLALQACSKCDEVARGVRAVDHTMTVRAKNCKIVGDVVLNRNALR